MANISPAGQREIIGIVGKYTIIQDKTDLVLPELCNAIQHGKIQDVNKILNNNEEFINADEGGNMVAKSLYRNFLMLAIDALEPEIATLLIERGIDINHKCWGVNGKQSARDLAVENCLDQVVLAIDSRLSASMQLFSSVSDGSVTKTSQLIGHIDTDINMKVNLYGEKTPGSSAFSLLMIAIQHHHQDVAKLLIQNNIDLTFKHQEWERPNPESDELLVVSFTALELATQNGMHDVVKMIKNKQLKIKDTKNSNGNIQQSANLLATQKPRDLLRDTKSIPSVEQDNFYLSIEETHKNRRQSTCCIVL